MELSTPHTVAGLLFTVQGQKEDLLFLRQYKFSFHLLLFNEVVSNKSQPIKLLTAQQQPHGMNYEPLALFAFDRFVLEAELG